jgi:hypothetical protein
MSLHRFLARSILPIRFFQAIRTRRPSRARKALRARRWQPSLEALESRFAPAVNISIQAGVLTAQCDNGFNQVSVFHTGSFAVINGQDFNDASYNSIRVNGGSGGTQVFIEANVKPVTVIGNSFNDLEAIGNGGSLTGILAPVSLDDNKATHVDIQDGADNTSHSNVVLSASSLTGLTPASAPINFGSDFMSGLTITVGNGNNTYTVTGTSFTDVAGANPTVLNNGNGHSNFNVAGIDASAPLTINTGGFNGDVMSVGNLGTLAGIKGTLTLNNVNDFTTVNINDGADNTQHSNVVLTDSSLTGLAAPINFGGHTVGGLNITVGNGNNTYTVVNTQFQQGFAGNLNVLNTGNGNDTVNIQGIDATSPFPTSPLTVNAGSGHDVMNVGNAAGSLAGIKNTLTINNFLTTSTMMVNINDGGDTTAHPNVMLTDSTLSGLSMGAITFHGNAVASLAITAGAGTNMYTVANSGSGNPTVLNTGNGDDTVNIQGTAVLAPLTVNAAGPGNDVVNVGNAGSLAGINGTLTLNNASSFSHVNIDDGADGANHPNVMLTSFSLTGLAPAPINFEGESLDGLTVTGGSGDNTYTVVNTQFSPPGNPTTLNTGNGNDTLNVQATNFNAPLKVSAGSGRDVVNVGNAGTLTGFNSALTISSAGFLSQVNINDGADNTDHANVQLTADGLTGLTGPAAPINFGAVFQRLLNIAVGNGNDNFLISGTPNTVNTLSTGTGTNTVTVTGGFVILAGNAAGTNTLTGPDAATTWPILGPNAGDFGSGGAGGSFTDYQNLVGGSGDNTFVFSDAATLSGTITGGGGTNTLDSSAYSTSEFFAVSGPNAGSGTVGAFSNIQNLIGGAGGNNDFAFGDGGSLDGSLNGGSGASNTLDYSNGFSGNVSVDLATGAASDVAGLGAGAVTNIQNALGASGGGSGFFNLLIGSGGNFLQGGTGRRNILVAGGSPSTLVGGDGEDLLIAGSTAYDTDPALANWQAIAAYWTGSDPFATRVSNLLSGTGVPILDPLGATGHVFGNRGGNTLSGNGALALLFSDGFDGISGFDPNSQQVTIGP